MPSISSPLAAACGVIGLTGLSLAQPLELPIVHRPFEHEQAQFGYEPWYSRNEPGFDRHNRPYIRSRSVDLHETAYIHTIRGGRWVQRDLLEPIRQAYPGFEGFHQAAGWDGTRIVFDAEDHLYTVLRLRVDGSRVNVLLHSPDYGRTFELHELPGGHPIMEMGPHMHRIDRPPMVAVYRSHTAHEGRWADYHDLHLVPAAKEAGRVSLAEPIHLTDNAVLSSRHSGPPTVFVSKAEATYFTWMEMAEAGREEEGSPNPVVRYSHDTGELSGWAVPVHTKPANNAHNSPAMAVDPEGHLHLLTGSHGQQFFYTRTLEPGSISSGWTEPETILETGWVEEDGGERGRQTYAGLVCDSEGTLHLTFRQWIQNPEGEHFPQSLYGALSYQRKPAGGEWSDAKQIVVPPGPIYSVHYHRLVMDRADRLFLSYSSRTDDLYFEDLDGRYHFRSVLISEDGGEDWSLLTTPHFLAGIEREADARDNPLRLRGRVRDEAGQPVSGAEVTAGLIESLDQEALTEILSRRSDEEGRFEIEGIYAADVELRVEHADEGSARVSVSARADESVKDVEVTLHR